MPWAAASSKGVFSAKSGEDINLQHTRNTASPSAVRRYVVRSGVVSSPRNSSPFHIIQKGTKISLAL